MLTLGEKTEIRNLLSRFNTIPEGETVVANLLRSLSAKIVDKALAVIVLNTWCGLVGEADARSRSGPISTEHALQLTESELLTTAIPNHLWSAVMSNSPFKTLPSGIGPTSNIKSLATLMRYLLGIYDLPDPVSGTPIPLCHHVTPAMRQRQLDRISRAMMPLKTRSLATGARIHHKRWFWVATSHGLADVLKACVDDEAAAVAVDKLGLVHFSRNLSTQSPAERYVVEVRLSPTFAPEYVKPSFVFSDHNPRFVAWTDTIARSDPIWGRAADLQVFHNQVRLDHGCRETVRLTPGVVAATDILDLVVLGYLDINRWGLRNVADGTEVFADRLRDLRSRDDVVEGILSFLE